MAEYAVEGDNTSPVRDASQLIGLHLDDLASTVSHLARRLGAVLRPSEVAPTKDGTTPAPVASEHTTELRGHQAYITHICADVQDLIHRLDI